MIVIVSLKFALWVLAFILSLAFGTVGSFSQSLVFIVTDLIFRAMIVFYLFKIASKKDFELSIKTAKIILIISFVLIVISLIISNILNISVGLIYLLLSLGQVLGVTSRNKI